MTNISSIKLHTKNTKIINYISNIYLFDLNRLYIYSYNNDIEIKQLNKLIYTLQKKIFER